MYPVKQRFLDAIRQNHQMTAWVNLYDVPTSTWSRANLIGGSVSIDRTSDVRRTASVEIVVEDTEGTVDRLKKINPYTTRFTVFRGIRYPDTTEEYVPLGYFWIDNLSWSDDDSRLVLEGSDFTSLILAAPMPFPRTVTSASTLSLISALAREVFSSAWNSLSPTSNLIKGAGVIDEPTGEITLEGGRWETIAALASGLGAEAWASTDSVQLQITRTPSLSNPAVWSVNAGEGGVLLGYSRSLSREGVYNSVVASGTSTDTPVYAIAEDTDPTSPTYIGAYGRSVLIVEDEAYTTASKAQQAANGILANSLGLASNLDLTSVPNPALDVGDVIEVVYPSGLTEPHIIDAIEVPLSPDGEMPLRTRSTTTRLR